MSAPKLQDHIAYPPRVLRAERAAAYLSMAVSTFRQLVAEGTLPPAIHVGGMLFWDRLDLDAAVEDWKAKGERGHGDSWDAIEEQEQET